MKPDFEAARRRMVDRVRDAYKRFEFHRVYHTLLDFCTVDLSAVYLDIIKDRLYVSGPDDSDRRAAQTVMWDILLGLVKLMAPVITFTAEEIWGLVRREGMPESVHMEYFPEADTRDEDAGLLEKWESLMRLREAISKALEEARRNKAIGSSQQARVILAGEGPLLKLAEGPGD